MPKPVAVISSVPVMSDWAAWPAAAAFGFGHGLALAALAPFAHAGIGRIALATMLAGVLLFSGSLAGGGLLGWSTALAPFGGTLMLLGWLLHGWHRLRG